MDFEKLKFKTIKFFIDSFSINVYDSNWRRVIEPQPIDKSMITLISIVKNYDTTTMPFFRCRVNVPGWLYTHMVANPDTVKVSLSLKYALFDQDVTDSASYGTAHIGEYATVAGESVTLADLSKQEIIEMDSGAMNSGFTYSEGYPVDLLLANSKSYFNGRDKGVNTVFTNTTLGNATAYVLTQMGVSNVLMSPPTNRTSYSEFKMPYLSCNAHIQRLCNDYRVYDTEATIFYDLDRTYILDKKPQATAYDSSEKYVTNVVSLNNTYESMSGFCGISFLDKEKSTVLNIPVEGLSVDSVDDMYDTYEYTDTLLTFVTDTATLDCLTPNKEFRVMIDNPKLSKYNGVYRIISYTCEMNNSGDYMSPTFKVTLGK